MRIKNIQSPITPPSLPISQREAFGFRGGTTKQTLLPPPKLGGARGGIRSANANSIPHLASPKLGEGNPFTSIKTTGFTLVELIVVIVILAILATIAFLSFSSQSSSARDSTRLADMSNIAKGLSVFNATAGKYPSPETAITIYSSGTPIGYQGYAGANVLGMIKISNGGKDPLDASTYYTYSTNLAQSRFQILGFLEDGSNTALSMMPFRQEIPAFARMTELGTESASANPSTYSGRYAITKGDQLGILLNSSTWVPAQTLNVNIDIATTTGSYIAQFTNKEKAVGTGSVLYVVNNTMKTGGSRFPGCDQYDIVIGSQTWAGCNSTQGIGIEWGYKDDGSTGSVSTCYDYAGNNTPANCPIGSSSMASNSKEKSWSIASGINGTVDNVWGKLYTWSQATQANNACPTGWHLPSDNEFEILETFLNGGVNCRNTTDGWFCSGLGWSGSTSKTISNNIVQALKIPLSGYRSADGFTFNYRGHNAALWSNSGDTTAYGRALSWSRNTVHRGLNDKLNGFSVRCMKD